MAYTINRHLANLLTSSGVLDTGKIPVDYITNDHIADNTLTTAQLHSSFTIGSGHIPANLITISHLNVTDGTNGQVLKTDGSGNLSFTTIESDKITEGNSYVEVVDTGSNGTITLRTEGSDRWQVTSTGHLLPATNAVFDIGSPTQKVRDLYVDDNSIHIGGDTKLSVDSDGDFNVTDNDGDPKTLKVEKLEIGSGNDKLVLEKDTDGNLKQQRKVNGSLQTARKTFVIGVNNSGDITEGTNKFYTDARVSTRVNTILSHSNHSNITVTKVGDQLRFSAAAQYGDSDVSSYLSGNGYDTRANIISAVTNGAPGALDTLNELAAALGDDANFSTTVTNSIATKWTQDNTKISQWDTAYGWGDHSTEGYVTSSGNTIIGTDSDINTSGAQVLDTLVMTDGVITSHSVRNLTLANLGYTGATNANYITNNNQLTNGAGYITSADGGNATTLDNIDSTGFFRNFANIGATDANNLTTRGVYGNSNQSSNQPFDNNAGTIIHLDGRDGSYKSQIFQYSANGAMYLRGKHGSSNSWSSWFQVYDEQHKPTYSELGTMAYSNLTGTPTIPTNNNQLTNGAGYTTFDGNYNSLSNRPTIPTNNNQLTNGAGYITSSALSPYATTSSLSSYATQSYVTGQINNLIDSAPGALNTLNELAAAIGDDANFSTTVTNSIAAKLPLAGGTMTGNLTISPSGSKIILDAYNTSQEGGGIFFREGFDSSNKYNLSIMARSRSNDGSADGLSINAYEGITFSTGSNSYNERLYLHSSAAFTVPITTTGTVTASGGNSSNWNTAYGWGNHASAGYLTSFDITTQTDSKYLRSNATDTASETITFSKGINVGDLGNGGITGSNYNITGVNALTINDPGEGIIFGGGSTTVSLYAIDDSTDSIMNFANATEVRVNGSKIWTSANDGGGSGLDADTVDGIQSSSFLRSDTADTASGKITMSTGIARSNHHVGHLEGSYNNVGGNSAKTNPIYTIGSAYNPTATSFSNMYGIGYAHPNMWGTGSGKNVGWGQYAVEAGVIHFIAGITGTWSKNEFNRNGNKVWDAGNDGSGSGLDADLLDGLDSSFFFKSYTNNNGGWSQSNRNFSVRSGGNAVGLHMEESDGTFGFNLYGDGSNYGFLDGEWGNWDVKKITNGALQIDVGSGLQDVATQNWVNAQGFSTSSSTNASTLDNLDSTQFLRRDVADSASQRISFSANATNNWDTIATASGSQGCIEIFNTGSGNDAFMTFHTGNDFALYFGLDADSNKLAVGGWSMGANKYEIYHAGNKPSLATLGYTGATNANYITNNTQLTNGAGYLPKNSNTMTGSGFKLGFHSGSGGTTFGNNHYSMGVDIANGSWSGSNYSDLIIGYHTGIRIGGGYSGIRFYNNSPTTDTNNDGNGEGNESLLMTIGGGGSATSGAHVTVENNLYVKDNLYIGAGANDGYFYSDTNGRIAFAGGDFYIQNSVGNYYNYATNQYIGDSSGDNIYFRGNTISGNGWSLTGAGILDLDGGHGALNITNSSILSSATSSWTGNPGGAGKIQYHSNRWYIVGDSSSNRIVQFRRDGSDKSYIDNNGALIGGGNWYNGNDGSGSGLDADLLDGLELHTGRNNVANRVVRTDQHGYIQAGWINTTSGTATGTLTRVYCSQDAYLRYLSPSSFMSSIGALPLSGGTMTANINFPSDNGPATTGSWIRNSTAYGYIQIGPANSGHAHIYTDRSNFYFNKTAIYANGNTMWHSANDGSGSGLDADTVDGIQGASLLRSDAADTFTGTLTMGTQQALVANNYGRGVFGVYSATRYQHVWMMGTAYKTSDNGTSYGNAYGLTYTHTNIGTGTNQAISGLSHQLQHRTNGTLTAAIGSGIWTSGNVTAYSDIAVKRNLVRIPNALEKVCSINGYTYERTDYVKDEEDENAPDILRQAGVVAQEIEKVLPEVVSGEDGNKAVAYGNVVALLIESIKELKDEVDDLKQQLKEK